MSNTYHIIRDAYTYRMKRERCPPRVILKNTEYTIGIAETTTSTEAMRQRDRASSLLLPLHIVITEYAPAPKHLFYL